MKKMSKFEAAIERFRKSHSHYYAEVMNYD